MRLEYSTLKYPEIKPSIGRYSFWLCIRQKPDPSCYPPYLLSFLRTVSNSNWKFLLGYDSRSFKCSDSVTWQKVAYYAVLNRCFIELLSILQNLACASSGPMNASYSCKRPQETQTVSVIVRLSMLLEKAGVEDSVKLSKQSTMHVLEVWTLCLNCTRLGNVWVRELIVVSNPT